MGKREINKMDKRQKKKKEINYIYELLQACLEEEGYVIPFAKYADGDYKGFDVPLRNGVYEKDNLLITITWR